MISRCSVNIWEEEAKKDSTIVESNFATEHNNFLLDIVGLSATFEGMSTAISSREQAVGDSSVVYESLRDISSLSYLHSYNNPQDGRKERKEQLSNSDIEGIYRIIEASLEETKENQS